MTEQGSQVEAGEYVDMRDKKSRDERWAVELDEDLAYAANQLDRDVVAPDQIRTVIRTFRERLFSEIFPGRTEVPKTLVFAKDDAHAEDITEIIREEFGKGNEFCKKITYRTSGEKPEDLLSAFRNDYFPRIAVSVDMIATGTDIKPLECLLFMRMVRSQGYFEQMKGRGTRVISDTDLAAVTADAGHKTHFVIVDAVGVCEQDKTDMRPLEKQKSVPLAKLMHKVALGVRDADSLESLAGRLSRLGRGIKPQDQERIARVSGGLPLNDIIHNLLDAVDPDIHLQHATVNFGDDAPEAVQKAADALIQKACAPFDSGAFRELLEELRKQSEQVIDIVSKDELISAGVDAAAKEQAQAAVQTFRQFIGENRDELTALQILYAQPYGQRALSYAMVKELAQALSEPPYLLTTDALWRAYAQLSQSAARGGNVAKQLANIISLIRFEQGELETLELFSATVEKRYERWLAKEQAAGRKFSQVQLEWLAMIRDHIATSVHIEMDDFDDVPFNQKGGMVKVYQLFGDELDGLLDELSKVLVG